MGDTPVNVSGLLEVIKKYGFEYFGVFYGKYRGTVVDNKPDFDTCFSISPANADLVRGEF